tara:strand:- start:1077 stop:4415 length:3339 start_codon:yes stop_codon:yes gene_type:complete
MISDPGCDNGILPFEPEEVRQGANMGLKAMMKQIHGQFSTDMLGNGPGEKNWGLINMILSDTRGNPLSAHNRKAYNGFRNYVDFLVDNDHETDDNGQFPYKVAEWLQMQMETASDGVNFNVNNTFGAEEITTMTFEQLGMDLFSGKTTLDIPDYGYKVKASIDHENDTVTYKRLPRKSAPDLTLTFDNNGGGTENSDYGFDLNIYLADMKQRLGDSDDEVLNVNIPGDTTRIEIIERLLDPETDDGLFDSADFVEDREYEFLAFDDHFDLKSLDEYPNFQKCFTIQTNNSPSYVLFEEILQQNGASFSASALKDVYNNMLDNMFSNLLKQVISNENAFLYGAKYDDLKREDADYVVQEGQTLDPAGTLYRKATVEDEEGGTRKIRNSDGILGISYNQFINNEEGTPDKTRVFYLDPTQFGGKYINPPIYIAPVRNEGWLGFVDVVFPELSPCKPSKTDLIDFEDIQDQIEEAYNNMPLDERLSQDGDCIVEAPYDKVLKRMSAANIQGIIVAACRIFASTHIIKSMATFTTFKPNFGDTYSDIYSQYVVESMEKSFKDAQGAFWEFLNPFKDEEFWYGFLEQAVQTYNRLSEQGKIDPPESVAQALLRLAKMQKRYSFPSKADWKAGRSNAFETYRSYKQKLNFEAIKRTEEDAKIILKEMVKGELNHMGAKLIENLKALNMEPAYSDIDYYFLTRFTTGGEDLDLDKEIVEVEEDFPDGPSRGFTSVVAEHMHSYTVDADGNGWAYDAYHPTQPAIHHKHEIKSWVVQAAASNCYPDCFDTYSIQGVGEHDHSISNMIVPIGDVADYSNTATATDSAPFIIEKYVKINDRKYSTEEGAEIITANDPSLNISDVYPGTLEQVTSTRIDPETGEAIEVVDGLFGELGVRHGLQFSFYKDNQKIEITSVEIDALDYRIGDFIAVQANSKELLCLIKLLKKDETFRLFTRYIFPLNKMLSIIALYNDLGFLESIGEYAPFDNAESGTMDSKPGTKVTFDSDGNAEYDSSSAGWLKIDDREPGRLGGMFVREWDNWDKELLRNSKGKIKKLFRSNYNDRDFSLGLESMWEFDPIAFQIKNMKELLRPKSGEAILPRWRRRKLRDNPFDAKGKLCEK